MSPYKDLLRYWDKTIFISIVNGATIGLLRDLMTLTDQVIFALAFLTGLLYVFRLVNAPVRRIDGYILFFLAFSIGTGTGLVLINSIT